MADIGDDAIFIWNVAGAHRTTPEAGPHDLSHRDAGQHIDGVEDRRPTVVTGAISPIERHGHDLDRDARLDAVDQVLAESSE